MIEKKSGGLERLKHAREISGLLILGYVLGDADGADLVEARINGEVAEVQHLDSALLAQSPLRDALLGVVRLRGAQSDAGRVDTVVLRGVHHQSAPTATDLEQAL